MKSTMRFFSVFLFVVLGALANLLPRDELAKDMLAAATAGKWDEARELAAKALSEGDNAISHQVLSQIYLLENKFDLALSEATKASDLEPENTNLLSHKIFHSGLVTQQNGDLQKALADFKESISVLGKEADVKSLEKAAIAVTALGDIHTAVEYLKRVWAIAPLYNFHNSIPFVRIVDLYDDQMEQSSHDGTSKEVAKRLGNITTITDKIFFDVSIDGGHAERIVLGLFGLACPVAVENLKFLAECSDEKKCYKGTSFHRVIKDFIVQGGDITPGDGTGRVNKFDRPFADEVYALALMHDGAGVVQMANSGPDSNGGQFVIMAQPAAHLNGAHVVVGKVLEGLSYVHKINEVAVDAETYRPTAPVTVVDCGLL